MSDYLKNIFTGLAGKFTSNVNDIDMLWQELVSHYNSENRYYHNLEHLWHLYTLLGEVSNHIQDQTAALFALFYHDVIYDVLRNDNENRSAALARERLRFIRVPEGSILCCVQHILGTKNHISSSLPDTNYFTDADLAILGQSTEVYIVYCKRIRKEYAVYPDGVYYAGRKKVLQHFLEMDRIFITEAFQSRFEEKARYNLKTELSTMP